MYQPIVIQRNKKYGNNYWNSDGPKVGMREVVLYSDLEFDHWLLTETNPTVETYCEQPKEISFVINGKLHTTIFDMWIKYKSGEENYIEVKYQNELQPLHRNYDRNMRQIQVQKEWCRINGFAHHVMTEREIRAHPIGLENRLKMLSSVKCGFEPPASDKVYRLINEDSKTIEGIYEILETEYSINEVLRACYWLTYNGKITTNIEHQPWSIKMGVSRSESYEDIRKGRFTT